MASEGNDRNLYPSVLSGKELESDHFNDQDAAAAVRRIYAHGGIHTAIRLAQAPVSYRFLRHKKPTPKVFGFPPNTSP